MLLLCGYAVTPALRSIVAKLAGADTVRFFRRKPAKAKSDDSESDEEDGEAEVVEAELQAALTARVAFTQQLFAALLDDLYKRE